MGTSRDDIQEWFEQGLNGGFDKEPGDYTHMIVSTDTFDYSDAPVYIKAGDNPRSYTVRSMEKIMECYDLRLPMHPQLNEGRAHHYDMACGLSDMSPEWKNLTGISTPPPLVQEADPEIDALLREDDVLLCQAGKVHPDYTADFLPGDITPMTGEGWYHIYENRSEAPNGPWPSMADMAEGLSMAVYPKDGYIVHATLKSDGPRFWMDISAVHEIDPDDLLSMPTWKNTLNDRWSQFGVTGFMEAALELGYTYFVWNGWVFRTVNQDITHPVCLAEDVA